MHIRGDEAAVEMPAAAVVDGSDPDSDVSHDRRRLNTEEQLAAPT